MFFTCPHPLCLSDCALWQSSYVARKTPAQAEAGQSAAAVLSLLPTTPPVQLGVIALGGRKDLSHTIASNSTLHARPT